MIEGDLVHRLTVGRYADLATLVRRAPPRCGDVRLVAIDGPGGAGKSVFAHRLAGFLGNAPIVHTDDFASWDEPIEWWHRLEAEVLRPMERGEPVTYQAYDWVKRQLGEWRELPASDVVVLEGVSSARRAVAGRLSLAIWVETPRATRLARGIARDGEAMRAQWEMWMAEEDAHYARDRTRDRADVIVDGAPSTTHEPESEYVAGRRVDHELHTPNLEVTNVTGSTIGTRSSVMPMLAYENPAAAIEWLERAFGFREDREQRYTGTDGTIGHAQMQAGGGLIALASPTPDYQSPARHRETCEAAAKWSQVPWVIDGVQVEVEDVDAHYERARAAGARLLTPIRDEPYGRLYNAEDVEGHRWMFIQPA